MVVVRHGKPSPRSVVVPKHETHGESDDGTDGTSVGHFRDTADLPRGREPGSAGLGAEGMPQPIHASQRALLWLSQGVWQRLAGAESTACGVV